MGSGCCDVGSSTSPHDTQPPDSNTTSSVAATRVTPRHYAQSPNSEMTSSGDAGSGTLPHDMQSPGCDTTNSTAVAAATWAAAHCHTTCNRPTVTRPAAQRRWHQCGQQHTAARHTTTQQ